MNDTFQIFNAALQLGGLIAPLLDITKELRKNQPLTTTEKVNVAAKSLFIVLKVANVSFEVAQNTSPTELNEFCSGAGLSPLEVARGLSVATGLADSFQITFHQWNSPHSFSVATINILAVVIFNVSQCASKYVEAEPLSKETQEMLKIITTGTKAVETALSVGKGIVRCYTERDAIGEMSQIFFNFIKQTTGKLSCLALELKKNHSEKDTLNVVEENLLDSVTPLLNWEFLTEIPSFLSSLDPFYSQFVCAINKKPIRHPVRIFTTPRQAPLETRYEESSVRQWITKNPSKRPPGWPATAPYGFCHLLVDTEAKNAIDTHLCVLSKQIKTHLRIL